MQTQFDPKIIAVAEQLLASATGADFTMEQLAEAAGVSRASLYRRIGSKAALIQHIAQARGLSLAELGQRDVRSTILQAARQCFAVQGIVRVTMEQIAQEAGVGVATVYRHFGDKDGLIRAFSNEFKPAQLFTEIGLAGTAALESELIPLIAALLTFVHKNRDIFRLTLAESPENLEMVLNLRNAPERTLNRLAHIFQEQVEAGRMVAEDPMDMALALMGMVMSFGFIGPLLYDLALDDLDGTAQLIARIFLKGVSREINAGD